MHTHTNTNRLGKNDKERLTHVRLTHISVTHTHTVSSTHTIKFFDKFEQLLKISIWRPCLKVCDWKLFLCLRHDSIFNNCTSLSVSLKWINIRISLSKDMVHFGPQFVNALAVSIAFYLCLSFSRSWSLSSSLSVTHTLSLFLSLSPCFSLSRYFSLALSFFLILGLLFLMLSFSFRLSLSLYLLPLFSCLSLSLSLSLVNMYVCMYVCMHV